MAARPILYNYWRSSASWRVRTALNLKKIEFDYVPVNMLQNEQFTEDHLKRNPLHQLPALQIDGHMLVQSLPIIEYLDETRNYAPYLLPREPHKRAIAREYAEMVNSYMQPLQNLSVLKRVAQMAGDEKRSEWAIFFIEDGFTALETRLKETAGEYMVGDEPSIADISLLPQYYNAYRFKVPRVDERFPTIARIARHLLEHPAFRAAHPCMQPDAAPEDRGNFAMPN